MIEVTDRDRADAKNLIDYAAFSRAPIQAIAEYLVSIRERERKESAERADKWAWGECIMVRQRESLVAAILKGQA